ncbi:pilin [Thiotrichales bacterium 19S11-10]|nr:pilin [Thiotrichales bacterium 19S11-10]MCF6806872.1 pilin [Thiotrichales bacterium 19S9-11]MCF6810841.1 pilin [Thiotrichales bacterium 19S9-12]
MLKQHGFSYIEATMITAVLGVIAAIAIPSYMTHLDRAKLAEAYTLISSKQSHVISQMITNDDVKSIQALPGATKGKYGSVNFNKKGIITYTFTDKKLKGNSVSLTPVIASDGSANWQCHTEGKFPTNPCKPFQ